LNENFQQVLDDHTAGDPMHEDVRWTNLTQERIAEGLAEAGTPVSVPVVKQLLHRRGFRRRKAQKSTAMGHHPDQDAQFRNIARLKAEFVDSPDPILSMDSKKKELIGPFFRPGMLWAKEVVEVFDHDFPSFATGVVIPHGLYDLKRDVGHIQLGTSHDTGQFACDHLEAWWDEQGRWAYPGARSILLLCDGGGSNSARHYLFKEDLQRLVDKLRVEIRVAHYPPYCSKYNPIEHRLFPHVSRACQGVIFESVGLVKSLIERVETKAGLWVSVELQEKFYETKRKVAEGFREAMKVVFDPIMPRWNYRVIPS
jgi:hypothetical protein